MKIIDLDSVIVSLRLLWMKRIFMSDCGGTWKSYLIHKHNYIKILESDWSSAALICIGNYMISNAIWNT